MSQNTVSTWADDALPEGFGTEDYFAGGTCVVRTASGINQAAVAITASAAVNGGATELTLEADPDPFPETGLAVILTTAGGLRFAGILSDVGTEGSPFTFTAGSFVSLPGVNSL